MNTGRNRQAVLVVEDEPLILLLALDIVDLAGFEGISASNADEALAILEGRDDIRIIFTDVDMPGSMDGVRLAHAVRGRWPPIKIVVTSGYPLDRPELLPVSSWFLPKPYSVATLSSMLHALSV